MFSGAVLAYLFKSAIEKCDFNQHVKRYDRNHADRIWLLEVGKLNSDKFTSVKAAKTVGCCVGITNRLRSVISEQSKLREDNSDAIDFFIAILCSQNYD